MGGNIIIFPWCASYVDEDTGMRRLNRGAFFTVTPHGKELEMLACSTPPPIAGVGASTDELALRRSVDVRDVNDVLTLDGVRGQPCAFMHARLTARTFGPALPLPGAAKPDTQDWMSCTVRSGGGPAAAGHASLGGSRQHMDLGRLRSRGATEGERSPWPGQGE